MTFWAPKDLQVSLAPENGAIGCGCGGTAAVELAAPTTRSWLNRCGCSSRPLPEPG